MKNFKHVTVAILTFNAINQIDRCLESLLDQDYPCFKILLIDNASTDGTVDHIKENYPNLQLLALPTNLGFAKAHNIGIRSVKSQFYMPLNPDVKLTPNFLSEIVAAIEHHDGIGSVTGKLLYMDENGREQKQIYTTGHLLTRSRSPSNRGYKRPDVGQYDNPELVFAANGAAPLYRREMLEDICLNGEYFCEDFFIYGEDHDLGWRAQLRGWECHYAPNAIGYHVGFGSGGIKNFRVQVQFTRNRYLTLVRNDQWSHLLRDIPFIFAYELIWQLSWLIRSPRRVLAHWLGAYQALYALFPHLKARRCIQASRITPVKSIRSYFVNQLW